eukprot:TRINITY_DN1280_c0_g1_i1.p1 TRINITY_DN1280_c0_g1~~TRINITY_DN1280_c0_g1_i1.p1  ORF type:complete len:274 (+),score=44.67 TRINITY_DN1280_c0_g1_i1:8-829(+)
MSSTTSSSVTTTTTTLIARGGSIFDNAKGLLDNLPNVIDVALVLGTTGWLYFIMKVPWNLYLSARQKRIDADESKEQGVKQDEQSLAKLKGLETRLLGGVLATHIASAIGIYALAWLTGERIIKTSSCFIFLGSAFFRPSLEMHRYLRKRIEILGGRVAYPTHYVHELIGRLNNVEAKAESSVQRLNDGDESFKRISKRIDDLSSLEGRHEAQLTKRVQELEERLANNRKAFDHSIVQISKKFEETIVDLQADKKMLEGVKMFLQLVRENLNK